MSTLRNASRAKLLTVLSMMGILGVTAIDTRLAAAEETGWYIGGGIGAVDLNFSSSDFSDGSDTSGRVDSSDTGWKVFGGYKFNKHLALEGGYVDFNSDLDGWATFQSGTLLAPGPISIDIQPKGGFVAAVGTVPIENFVFFGKAGFLNWDTDVTTIDSTGIVNRSEDGTDTMFGVGVEYRFRNGLAVRGEFERFTNVFDTDIDLFSVGVLYHFRSK